MAQSCGEQSDCPGIIWYGFNGIPIDSDCMTAASVQYEACLGGTGGPIDNLLCGVDDCLFQMRISLCMCPPPSPPASGTGAKPPAPGHGCDAGDSTDPGSGVFTSENADLELSDVMPIRLSRVYRELDQSARSFGAGVVTNYDLEVVIDYTNYAYADLVLPDMSRVHYTAISSATSSSGAVFQHTSSPTIYYGSTITWNNDGWELSLKDGTQMFFSHGMLVSITDRNSNQVQIQRDEAGNALQITSPNGRWISLTYQYNNVPLVTRAQDSAGRTVWYAYDGNNRLSKAYDVNGNATSYAYDSSGRMTTITTPAGNVRGNNVIDSNNRVTQQTMPDGSQYQFNYTLDSNSNLVQTDVISPNGTKNSLTFNSNGYILNNMVAVGTSVEQDYQQTRDPNTNLITSTTDALGRTTNYTYDAMGNQASVTRIAGTSQVTTSTTYDPIFSQPLTRTDELGHTWTYTLDSRGNRIAAVDPDGHQTSWTYNSSGQPASFTDAAGNTTTYGYASGLLTSTTDPAGDTTTYVYDAAGRMTQSTDPLSNVSSHVFDALGNLAQTINAIGAVTTYGYDSERNRISLTDANGGTTKYGYDSMNRLISATDPLGATEHYFYDSNGRLQQFTDRRGKVAMFQYDAQNRKTFAGFGYNGSDYESTIGYQYDNADRLTQIVDSHNGTTSRSYDNFDNLIDEKTPQGEVTYQYDSAHQLQNRTVVNETPVNYTYDNAGTLLGAAQGDSLLTYAYDSGGRLSSTTLPNGVVQAYSYDSDSRVATITYSDGSAPLGDLAYTYDANGRVLVKGGSFASVVMPQSVSGNRFNAGNEMTAFNGTFLSYDGNGNLLNDGTNTYTWDSRNQLASLAGPVPASYSYDSTGRRVSFTVNGGTTLYVYENGSALAQEISAAGVHLLSGLGTSRLDTGAAVTFLSDDDNSVIALTDSTGTIQTQYSYGPFGSVSNAGATSTNPYQFKGLQNDSTGVYYGAPAYYNPLLGIPVGRGLAASATNSESTSFATLSAPSSSGAIPASSGSCDKCAAKLEYGSVHYLEKIIPGLKIKNSFHAYWWIKDGQGSETFSGEPENPTGEPSYGHLILQTNVDPADGPTGPSGDYGCNSELCNNDSRLRRAAAYFPSYLMYEPVTGPNSNSTARYLGDYGEFSPLIPPNSAIKFAGWDFLIPFP